MTDKEWQLISDLFGRALDMEPPLREQFIETACTDKDVQVTVKSLLAEDERLGSSLLNPDLDSLIRSLGCDDLTAKQSSTPGISGPDVPARYIGLQLNGRYVLETELGSGGTSIVYLAHDRTLPEKRWVVKILNKGAVDHEWFRKKFEQEKTVLTRLDGHEGIVTVTDAGELPEGQPYFVMPYVDGTTLKSEIKKGPMDFLRVAHIVRQIGNALSFAHAKGIYHLDLKPGNIILQNSDNGQVNVRLIDFGTAKIKSPNPGARTEVTRLAGTPGYMAPEQYLGRPSASSDVYALGVIALEMLIGSYPSEHEFLQLDLVRTKKKAADLSHPLPEVTQRVISRAFALEPTQRHSSPAAFGEELARSLVGVKGWQVLRRAGALVSHLESRIPFRVISRVFAVVLLTLAVTLLSTRFLRRDDQRVTTIPTATGVPSRTLVATSQVDELREDYKYGVEQMRNNLLLQFSFVVVGLLIAWHARSTFRLPALGITLSTKWLYFVIPVVLTFLWLQFGFLLDDLIKWRAEAWRQLLETGSTARASGFNDGGYMDGWFMCFRPLEHSIKTTFFIGSALFFCLEYHPLFAANHACTVVLLLIGAQRSLSGTQKQSRLLRVLIGSLPWFALAFIALSHLQFRFGGPNPNWMQPIIGVFSFGLAYLLYRHSRDNMHGTVEGNILARAKSAEVNQ